MFKTLFGLAATGVVAVVLYKILAVLLLPVIAVAIGVGILILKIGFILLMLAIAAWVFRRMKRSTATTA